jgi:hypothetical protein
VREKHCWLVTDKPSEQADGYQNLSSAPVKILPPWPAAQLSRSSGCQANARGSTRSSKVQPHNPCHPVRRRRHLRRRFRSDPSPAAPRPFPPPAPLSSHALPVSEEGSIRVRNQMPVSLRGGGGELGKLKTLTCGFTNFAQR